MCGRVSVYLLVRVRVGGQGSGGGGGQGGTGGIEEEGPVDRKGE